jgi:anti-anti-sigma regulatory factor
VEEAVMVLRITQENGSDSGTILRLEGRIVEEGGVLLEHECAEILRDWDEVHLDLTDITFIDRSGVEALQRLSGAGVEIVCPSGPVASVLEGAGVPVTLNTDDLGNEKTRTAPWVRPGD